MMCTTATMMMKTTAAAAAALALAFTAAPLPTSPPQTRAHAAERVAMDDRPSIGVYKITGNHPDVEDLAIGCLTSAVGRLSSVRTMERAKLRQAFSEEVLRREGIVAAVRRGRAVAPDVDYLIIGEVDASWQPYSVARCTMTVRLVDCSNDVGNVVATLDAYGSLLGGTWQEAVRIAADKVANQLAAYFPTSGQVLMQSGGLVYVNLTSFDNVRRGTRLKIFLDGYDVVNPATGKLVRIRSAAVEAKVIEVNAEYSVAELKGTSAHLKGGELVEVAK